MTRPDFHLIYRPLIATPLSLNETYDEIAPCVALRPYICCFWGSHVAYQPGVTGLHREKLIIPDTCMDLIFIDKNIESCASWVYFIS